MVIDGSMDAEPQLYPPTKIYELDCMDIFCLELSVAGFDYHTIICICKDVSTGFAGWRVNELPDLHVQIHVQRRSP